jgi:hypothetical protein
LELFAGWAGFRDLLDRTFGDGRRDVAFIEEEPYHFLRIRKSQRVSDEEYIEQFRTTIKERVTQGGASGAFFFFSRDEKFIAKSCTSEEFAVLTLNAKPYADYLESQRGRRSYISKVRLVAVLQSVDDFNYTDLWRIHHANLWNRTKFFCDEQPVS